MCTKAQTYQSGVKYDHPSNFHTPPKIKWLAGTKNPQSPTLKLSQFCPHNVMFQISISIRNFDNSSNLDDAQEMEQFTFSNDLQGETYRYIKKSITP